MQRRSIIKLGGVAALTMATFPSAFAQLAARTGQKTTEWGWPLPYEQISPKSVEWLKAKGWWPLQIGIQAYYASVPLWQPLKLAEARGLKLETPYFVIGAQQNEAAMSGKLQGNIYGSFPFLTYLLRSKVPAKAIANGAMNLRISLMVAPNSPVKKIEDLLKLDHKPVIGLVVGSVSEFYLQATLRTHGMKVSDVILKNLSPADMLLMPQGLDAVIQWDPFVVLMLQSRKNAREIDSAYSYNFVHGVLTVVQELIDHVPDVVQAISDMYIEGLLFTRHDPKRTRALLKQQDAFKFFGETEMDVLIDSAIKYKPTMTYTFPEFWAAEDAQIAKWLLETGRIKGELTKASLQAAYESSFLANTYKKLGWRVPSRPPWIPEGWQGVVGAPPYPKYRTLEEPAQPWPEKGDLL